MSTNKCDRIGGCLKVNIGPHSSCKCDTALPDSKLQARLDAALDALVQCRQKRDYYRAKANGWADCYYAALRGEMTHDVPVDMDGLADDE